MPLQHSIEAARINSNHFHGSFSDKKDDPGGLEIEDRVPAATRAGLTARGHKLDVLGPYGVSTGIVAVGVNPVGGTCAAVRTCDARRYAFGW